MEVAIELEDNVAGTVGEVEGDGLLLLLLLLLDINRLVDAIVVSVIEPAFKAAEEEKAVGDKGEEEEDFGMVE